MKRHKKNTAKIPLRRSVQMKFALSYLALIVSVLAILNTYPVFASQDLVFKAKQTSLQNQASVIASTISSLGDLTQDNVTQVMDMLDESSVNRVLITNTDGLILFDTVSTGASRQFALLQEVSRALAGNDVFTSSYSEGAFRSTAAVPVVYRNATIGAVYLYEYDSQQGGIVTGLQQNMLRISIVLLALAFLLSLLLSRTMTRRISRLISGIGELGDGSYSTRIQMSGQDELAALAHAFNDLTERLEKTDEVRKRFVSDASHELKTPLASIKLLTDSITQNGDMDEETIRDFVSDIGMEADRLTRITEKLLALTRMDNGSKAQRSRVDLGAVLSDALHMLTPLAHERNVTILPSLEQACFVLSSADEMYQVLFNLVENAIKYNHEGGTIWIDMQRKATAIEITVADSGIGIPEEDCPKIFDRFYRVDKARSREAGGTGLGLSIVRDTLVTNGGSISVSPRPEGGSVFTVVLPCAPEEVE